jgi:hypothetical protein
VALLKNAGVELMLVGSRRLRIAVQVGEATLRTVLSSALASDATASLLALEPPPTGTV